MLRTSAGVLLVSGGLVETKPSCLRETHPECLLWGPNRRGTVRALKTILNVQTTPAASLSVHHALALIFIIKPLLLNLHKVLLSSQSGRASAAPRVELLRPRLQLELLKLEITTVPTCRRSCSVGQSPQPRRSQNQTVSESASSLYTLAPPKSAKQSISSPSMALEVTTSTLGHAKIQIKTTSFG